MNCARFCKKTKTLRNSKYCEEWCIISENEIEFSCDLNLKKKKDEEELNLMNCIFNDIDHKKACFTCMKLCKKNKNAKIEEQRLEMEKLNSVVAHLQNSSLPVNMNPDTVRNITNQFKKNPETIDSTKDAIETINIARNVLEGISNGKSVNPSSFAIISNHFRRKALRGKKK